MSRSQKPPQNQSSLHASAWVCEYMEGENYFFLDPFSLMFKTKFFETLLILEHLLEITYFSKRSVRVNLFIYKQIYILFSYL